MATLYGVNATKRDVTVPAEKIDANAGNARLKVLHDKYVASGALTSGDVIKFRKIPKGARVIEAICKYSDLGTTGTGKLGWEAGATAAEAADDDGLMASLDFNAAADCILSSQNLAAPIAIGKEFSEEVQVSLTLTANTTAAGTIEVLLLLAYD
jgi:hypothetical protein